MTRNGKKKQTVPFAFFPFRLNFLTYHRKAVDVHKSDRGVFDGSKHLNGNTNWENLQMRPWLLNDPEHLNKRFCLTTYPSVLLSVLQTHRLRSDSCIEVRGT